MSELDYQPGDEIHVFSSTTWHDSFVIGRVEKITPSGQISVKIGERTMRFTPRGEEIGMGGSWSRGSYILSKAKAAERAESCKESMRANKYRSDVRAALERMDKLRDLDSAPALAAELRKLLAYVEAAARGEPSTAAHAQAVESE